MHPWDYSAHGWTTFQWRKQWLISNSFLNCAFIPLWGRISLRLLTLTCSQKALHLSLQELERIHPMFSRGPVIWRKHTRRPNVYLSCQLSGDRNTKDSCDSGGTALEMVWRKLPNRVSVTEKCWAVCPILITTKVLSMLKRIQSTGLTEWRKSSCAQEAFSSAMHKILTFTRWKRASELNWKQLSVTWDICIPCSSKTLKLISSNNTGANCV